MTLTGYNNALGDAAKIYSDDSEIKIFDTQNVDVTQYLKDASILDVPAPHGASVIADLFGDSYIDVALCALETPLFDSGDIEAF